MALWLLYEDTQEGFRPALKYVEDRTGIRSNKISEIRKELIIHGLIALTDEQLIIDWDRVRIFASLDKPLPKHGKHNYAPVRTDERDWSKIPLRKTHEYASLRFRQPMRQLSEWEEDFFDVLEEMTAEEYRQVVCGMGVNGASPKEGYITYMPQPGLLPVDELESAGADVTASKGGIHNL